MLSLTSLLLGHPLDGVISGLLWGSARSVMRHRQLEPLLALAEARIEAIDDAPTS